MDDLNRTTNRLRRKFDPTSNYLETKAQMEQVMDSGRRVNQVMTKGNYGSQAERYWAALRTNINDLARCYNLMPLGAKIHHQGPSGDKFCDLIASNPGLSLDVLRILAVETRPARTAIADVTASHPQADDLSTGCHDSKRSASLWRGFVKGQSRR